ncbi:ladderlectin [Oreochromis niloticus]|uniref:ladderlectin n=1 Tax=Oreochromis niloticus TaxID=8128 RepID=UPI00022B3CBC|nr:ladderlectin [Oreochromis niloticus]XP_025756673.1 ladderlectin [Oreochromis niloticus]CAI5661130.1 unnamed protein product [Mustela putorius furo]
MKLLTVSALLCAMMAMHTVAAWSHVGCPYGWTRFYRRCFRYIPRRMNWAAAERNCLSMGANLASVHSSREYHLIQRLTAYHGYRVTWIGGHDAPREGIWFWSDGSRFNYRHWCRGEPNNHHNQDCLQINYSGSKCWDDQHCHVHLPSICVRKIYRCRG